ncbi:MAG: cytochrome c biogenesis protein CcsA [Pirellulaceae bacterium]|nr:cytochrome c biogenesis protein CcsA [Pirellulaceae bacterium]
MSAPAFPTDLTKPLPKPMKEQAAESPLEVLDGMMQALASLKLTVVLFALGIFVVFVGTLAQTQADIWQVVRDYFHAWVMWIDINLFFPKSFFPNYKPIEFPRIPFPGGYTIGALMAVNLIAAHGWRFKIQASGVRLIAGLATIALGVLITAVVVMAGHNDEGFQAKPPFSWDVFWQAFLGVSALTWVGGCLLFGVLAVKPLVADRSGPIPPVRLIVAGLAGLVLVSLAALLAWGFLAPVRPGDEAVRIVWQLMQGGFGGLVMLAGCILVFRKRGGMVLLHAGIGLLMVNELFVARQAAEWQIFLQEGQTTDHMRDIRAVELAIIDRSAEKTDTHTVIPQQMLRDNFASNIEAAKADKPAQSIKSSELPFQVAVLDYYANADVRTRKPGEETPATKGRGLTEAIVPLSAAKGTDTGGSVDMAAAYVRLTGKDGQDLGTYLLSQLASEQLNPEKFAERVTVDGKEYQLFLRFKRDYLGVNLADPKASRPFTVSLVDVRKDDYVASNTPRNYSSDVRIEDPAAAVDLPVHIKMNDPLRYRALTFYQSGYNVTPQGEATTLQVVRNRVWMIPYVACGVVAIGMLAHFLITVTRFVTRREGEELASGEVVQAVLADGSRPAKKSPVPLPELKRKPGLSWSMLGLPALVAGLFFVAVASSMRPPKPAENGMDFARFGQLPVADQGRIKPLDSLARNSLQAISNREYVKLATVEKGSDGKEKEKTVKLSAVEWLLDVITGSPRALEVEIFRIEHPQLINLFELENRPGNFRYSVSELRPHIDAFIKQAAAAAATAKDNPDSLTLDQRKVLELDARLKKYLMLVESFGIDRLPSLPTEEEFQRDPAAARQKLDTFRLALAGMNQRLEEMNAPRPIPIEPRKEDADKEYWQTFPPQAIMSRLMAELTGQEPEPATEAFRGILAAYVSGDGPAFNRQVAEMEKQVARVKPPQWDADRVEREAQFNSAAPFALGWKIYVVAFLLAVVGWLLRYPPLNWSAFTLIVLTFVLHTAALWLRIDISGRPPITNLYSSAVAIGWACALFGIVIEAIFRLGIGNVLAAVSGAATLLIAALLASSGDDTVGVMQAVLDTQFWLATHVVCISLGYAATFVAGIIGFFYILMSVSTPNLDARTAKDLGRMIYGVICFAIFLSFVGTVLGGLWADDSWGRFWGWDPKENGALMIVMWNALVLHARWDKIVGDRGLAVLSLGGNIITAWSWFGVNQLGIGLHSYGFTSGVVDGLKTFVAYMLVCVVFGVLPLHWWWSRAGEGSNRSLAKGLGFAFLAINVAFLAAFSWQAYKALV